MVEALTTQTGCVMRTHGALPSQGFSSLQLLWADLSCGGEGWAGEEQQPRVQRACRLPTLL